jgi:hypothetical protein
MALVVLWFGRIELFRIKSGFLCHGVRLAYVVSHEVAASKAGIKTAM